MIELALAALFRALTNRLTTSGDAWAGRAEANKPMTGMKRPYVVWQWQGGGERNRVQRKDAEFVVTVRVVSDTQTEAFTLGARLAYLLNDMGEQDKREDDQPALNGGPDWHILTTTQEGALHLPETVDSKDAYHEGFFLRVRMEQKV